MLLLGLIISTISVPGWTGKFVPTDWAVLSLVLIPSLWLQVRMNWYHWLGLTFLAYAALSAAWAPFLVDSGWIGWKLLILALAFRWGSALDDLRPLYKGLALGMGVSSIICIFQHFGFHPVDSPGLPAGLFYSSIAMGGISALVITCLASEGLWLWAIPCIPALVLAGSRGAWLLIALMLVINLSRRLWPALLLLAACGFVMMGMHHPSDIIRLACWQAALSNLHFFGNGLGSFQSIYLQISGQLYHAEFVHNDYLHLLYELGIGAVLIFWLVFALAWDKRNEPGWQPLVAILIFATFSFPIHIPLMAFIGGIVAGHLSVAPSMDGPFLHRWRLDRLLRSQPSSRSPAVPV